MCASARNMMLRSTDHVCKFKESHHPHPTPPHPTPPHPTLRRWPDVIADKSKNTLKHHGHLRSVLQLHTYDIHTWHDITLRYVTLHYCENKVMSFLGCLYELWIGRSLLWLSAQGAIGKRVDVRALTLW